MAAVTTLTKTAADNRSFQGAGVLGVVDTYAATMIPAIKPDQKEQFICVDATGNSTINAATVLTNLRQWDHVFSYHWKRWSENDHMGNRFPCNGIYHCNRIGKRCCSGVPI